MTAPEDTSKREPLVHLAGMLGGGSAQDGVSRYIEEQEAAGQREVVNSTVLPRDMRGLGRAWGAEARAEFEALGFVFGDVVDDLFVNVTLPAGWTREGSDHAMWSHVVDERGVKRVAVFYKAAFYDRSAHCSLSNPGSAAVTATIYGDGPVTLPEQWDVFTVEERQAFEDGLRASLGEESYCGEEAQGRARAALLLLGAEPERTDG